MALQPGKQFSGRKSKEEFSDIKLEFTKLTNFTNTRQEPDEGKLSRPDLSTGPEVTKGLV